MSPACDGASDGAFRSLCSDLLARIGRQRPQVQILTSPVAMELSANALLAIGAVPSLTEWREELRDFLSGSDALVVNLGMLDERREEAIRLAVQLAQGAGCPWVMDPVKVERSSYRHRLACEMVRAGPAVVRANRQEMRALFGDGRSLREAAGIYETVLLETGETDRIISSERELRLTGGSPLMDRVTAAGCALSACTGAFLAVSERPFDAAAAACLLFGHAGSRAGAEARGPGSFVPAFLDELAHLAESGIPAGAGMP